MSVMSRTMVALLPCSLAMARLRVDELDAGNCVTGVGMHGLGSAGLDATRVGDAASDREPDAAPRPGVTAPHEAVTTAITANRATNRTVAMLPVTCRQLTSSTRGQQTSDPDG